MLNIFQLQISIICLAQLIFIKYYSLISNEQFGWKLPNIITWIGHTFVIYDIEHKEDIYDIIWNIDKVTTVTYNAQSLFSS